MKKIILKIVSLSIASMCFGQTTNEQMNEVVQHYENYIAPKIDQLDLNNVFGTRLASITEVLPLPQINTIVTFEYETDRHFWNEAIYSGPGPNDDQYIELFKENRIINFDERRIENILTSDEIENSPIREVTFEYDELGNPHVITTSIFQNNIFVENELREYFYYPNAPTVTLDQTKIGGDWNATKLTNYMEFVDTLLPINEIIFDTSSNTVLSDTFKQFDYVFEENSHTIKEMTLSVFDNDLEEYIPQIRLEISNNPQSIIIIGSSYNEIDSSWTFIEKIEKFYNSNQQLIQEIFFEEEDANLADFTKLLIYNYEVSVSSSEIPMKRYDLIYANPIKNGQTIQVSGDHQNTNTSLTIHNMSGQLMSMQSVVSNQTITWPSNLPNGMYLLNLVSDNQSLLAKKVIQQ